MANHVDYVRVYAFGTDVYLLLLSIQNHQLTIGD